MLKALLKKEFLQLNDFYLRDRKTGKRRSPAGAAVFLLLFALVFVSLGASVYYVGDLLAKTFLTLDMAWLYFSLMGMTAIFAGVIGGVFMTYAGLYRAKDNELLLSMPIPPAYILTVRLIGVYAMGLLYESVVFVPTIFAYWANLPSVSFPAVLFPVLLLFVISLFVLTLTCALGWVVALISSRLKNRTAVTVILTLAFIALYYFVYFRINTLLQQLAANAERIGRFIKTFLAPVYYMGRAGEGDGTAFLLCALFSAVLAVLVFFILSRTFLRIATMNGGVKKTAYREKTVKAGNIASALYRKELRRFLSSAAYLMNMGLGLVLLPAAVVAVYIKRDVIASVKELLPTVFPGRGNLIPVLVTAAVCVFSLMDIITAPSVSLEGKNLWIVQSMPVDARDVLRAKLRLHLSLVLLPILICIPLVGLLFGVTIPEMCFSVLFGGVYTFFTAVLGLSLNLKKPNLEWTNETMPIKQGASVGYAMLIGFAVLLLFCFGGYFLSGIAPWLYELLSAVLLLFVSLVLYRFIMTRGARIFSEL